MLGFVQQVVLLVILTWQSGITMTPLPLLRLPHDGRVGGAIWHDEQILTWSDAFYLWELGASQPQQTLLVGLPIDGARWLEDGTLLAWVNSPLLCRDCVHQAMLWIDFDSPPLIYTHPVRVTDAMLSPDGTHLLTSDVAGSLRIWERQQVLEIMAHTEAVLGIQWNADGTRLLSWSIDGTARVWDATSGDLLLNFQHEAAVLGARWNNDETQVVTWSRDGLARVWNAASGLLQYSLPHQGWVTHAAWGQNNTVITTSTDGYMRLWVNNTLEQQISLGGPIVDVVRNIDGSQLLVHSLAYHSYLTVWDVASGGLAAILPHGTHLNGAAWVDNRVLTWADDGWARLWVVPSADDCIVSTPFERVNQREVPSVNGAVAGRLAYGEARLAVGQIVDREDFVWWQLADGSWVRDDVVEARGACAALPVVNP